MTVTTATEGTTFKSKVGVTRTLSTYKVGPKCEANRGGWYCITHDMSFINNMMKDGHIGKGNHTMTWVCVFHGPEVP